MSVVRISRGSFRLSQLDQIEGRLAQSQLALRQPLEALAGLIHYYVGIDRERGSVTNISVWDTLEHAHQMDTLPAMLSQRPILEGAGVVFESISNHETLWTVRE